MTDLERLWDDYPTDPAPTRAILAAAHGRPRARRRLLVRPLLSAGVVTALAGAFVTGVFVSGGGDGGGDGGSPGAGPGGGGDLPRHVAFQADLAPAKSCADLLRAYVDRGLDQVGPWGWGMPDLKVYESSLSALSMKRDAAATPGTVRQNSSDTGTNVQETGVDEPDTVKTDGTLLAVVRGDELTTYDVTGSSTRRLGSLRLPGVADAEILLSGDTLVAVGADDGHRDTGTRVVTVSLADPTQPSVSDQVAYDARLVSARQHGSAIRIVLASPLPDLDFVSPGRHRTTRQALAENRRIVERSTIDDWLPTMAVDDGKATDLLDCGDVAVPSDAIAVGTTSVVGFAADAPAKVDAIALAGQTDIAYESADHLYLATSGNAFVDCIRCPYQAGPLLGRRNLGTSYLFDFALDGVRATHVASGQVEGVIRDRWSMDEAGGVLRVAVAPSSETGPFNAIVTFARDAQDLVERGRLDHLGRNEELQSVRWFDDLALLVTYRQVDPLYSVDLTDTAHPRLIGGLKVPGFSAYLHPLGKSRMIGVGEGPDGRGGWGARIGLFYVRDVRHVRLVNAISYGSDSQALAGGDPRTFTWLPSHRTILTVVERWAGDRRVGYLSVLRLAGGRLHEHRMAVEYGDDVDLVRAVPMPDGRVVLVTGEKAQFFEL
ncbi:hypothetical protein GCM10022237_13170 [Nocardioides ginsengisoli]|uniref:Beta-propeller domain-containing protein n=1 Tax=Nocardioides ginsengisoli TaxID=363868 RepID=A0ABW3W089_9ACTN